MSLLAKQQQALLALLFDWPAQNATNNIALYVDNSWARGQKVYQANGHALACSALRAAYPVVAQLVGDKSFDALARALWHAKPPRRGDAAQWGDGLPDFVHSSEQLADTSYLADVATLEWALHCAASAADAVADPSSFTLLSEHDPLNLQLLLAPGCTSLSSPWPVVSILNAHLHQSPALEQVGQLMRFGVQEDAVVWRSGLQVKVRLAQAGEAAFVANQLTGLSLGAALEQAKVLDIGAWLPMAVQSGLLLGVRLCKVEK
jgi:hypothetical protein